MGVGAFLAAQGAWASDDRGGAKPPRTLAASEAHLTLDARLDDPFWTRIPKHAFEPGEQGVPRELGGRLRVGLRGGYLCLGAELPEPGGKVLARSIGRNPAWEADDTLSPPVEDRLAISLSWPAVTGAERQLSLEINPWGGYRLEADGDEIIHLELPVAARVDARGWTVETALPLGELGFASDAAAIRFQAKRIRSRRPLAPEFHWYWPAKGEVAAYRAAADLRSSPGPPDFQPPALGNTDPPFEVGRVLQVPPVVARWDHPAWSGVPAFELPRNDPLAPQPSYRTRVKWMHDGSTLAVLAEVSEPEPVIADSGGRDARVDDDDHLALYLATSGSRFLEIIINPVGAIRDSLASGPHIIRPDSSFKARIDVQTEIRHGGWIARVDIPLDECAHALGEVKTPSDWRAVLVRHRAPRAGEPAEVSALPALGTPSFFGPVRYRRLHLVDTSPTDVSVPIVPALPKSEGLAAELRQLDPNVWSRFERNARQVRSMVRRHQRLRAEKAIRAERRDWRKVETREDWERFRDERLSALRKVIGEFPPERPPLDVRVTGHAKGDGYRLENLVFQVRPGLYAASNLYLPLKPASSRMPAIIILHSFHYPRTQGELHDMGALWARTGTAVLLVERLGFGERVETSPWYRQPYASRFTFKKQLGLIGETFMGWMAWDLVRAVDYLHERPDIDPDRITLIGSVAGGGEPAGLAAALDSRIAAVVPYNYDQGHARLDADIFGEIAHQISPWVVMASVAPRRYVRAFEFGWEGAEQPEFPHLWTDGWARSEKVWNFYNARENLGSTQGYGLIRLSTERVSHCFSVGPQQRQGLYPLLQHWFGISFPSEDDQNILPDSRLSTNPWREEARRQEAQRRRPNADVLCISPADSAKLRRRPLHAIALEMGHKRLKKARAERASLNPTQRKTRLCEQLRPRLGDVEPSSTPDVDAHGTRTLSGAVVEALSLSVEDGIAVPLLLIRPSPTASATARTVVAVAQGGKERFLARRAAEIARLLENGVNVALPDLRGTGETAPDRQAGDASARRGMAELEFDLASTPIGSRLKDLRTVLAYLRQRPDVSSLALWGASLMPENPPDLWLDEMEYHSAPQIQHPSAPQGPLLVILAALFEEDVRAVAVSGGILSYVSVLESPFTYMPFDALVPGLLTVGDVADLAAVLAPRPLLIEAAVDGPNVRVGRSAWDEQFAPALSAYRRAGAAGSLAFAEEPGGAARWLLERFR